METPKIVSAAKNRVTAPLESGRRAFNAFKNEGIVPAVIGMGNDFGKNNRALLHDMGVGTGR